MSGQNTSAAVMQRRSEPHDIVTIAEARERGLRWYFTGQPCAKGHTAKRSVSNRDCRRCVDERRAAAPEKLRAKDRRRHERCREARNAQSRASRARHVEERREYDRQRYHHDQSRKDWQKGQAKGWAKSNRGKRNAIIAARREHIKRATPPWLTDEDRAAIRAIYREAAAFGPGVMHVDHIIPLRGKHVCGLHVPSNLRIIPALTNIKKSNRYGAE